MQPKRITANQIEEFFSCEGMLAYEIIGLLEDKNHIKPIFTILCPHCESYSEYEALMDIPKVYNCQGCDWTCNGEINTFVSFEVIVNKFKDLNAMESVKAMIKYWQED